MEVADIYRIKSKKQEQTGKYWRMKEISYLESVIMTEWQIMREWKLFLKKQRQERHVKRRFMKSMLTAATANIGFILMDKICG